ncbi:MAG: 1,4-dihydroxy-2-naphthoate octaprenyltransferase [Thermoguttaceae bacterium]|nr:1,4-dihydroxy-2-naphthoate octaprenyltransferase [Thermoguttaceae bacterium]
MPDKSDSPVAAKRPSALGAWFLAARPKTLPAASIPVVVALALAWGDLATGRVETTSGKFLWIPAICCFLFALLAQIAANFVNDYADFKKGSDGAERIGPARAVASGWIAPKTMLLATFLTLVVACGFGLATILYGGWKLVFVGALACVFCLLYSAGPLPLAYIGLGDVLVVSFFGFVAVAFTYFLQAQRITLDAALVGIAIGFAVDNILVANNYRDRDEDRANRKFTLIAIFGERFGRYFYLANGLIVVALLSFVANRRGDLLNTPTLGALVVYLALHLSAWRTLAKIRSGPGLVRVLALSSRNLVVLGVLLAFALVE